MFTAYIHALLYEDDVSRVMCFKFNLDLDKKPKRLLRNIPAQHLYLRMAITGDEIDTQLDKVKSAELVYLFLACSKHHAQEYLKKVQGIDLCNGI